MMLSTMMLLPMGAMRTSMHHASKIAPARTTYPFMNAADDSYVCSTLNSPSWQKTSSGLSFKDLNCGGGDSTADGSIIQLQYTATIVSTGEVIEKTSTSRPLTFMLGDGRMPLFQEAVAGMGVGGRRVVNLLPSSQYSASDETIQFEFELVGLTTGLRAGLFQVGGVRGIVRTAVLLSFVPDVLRLVGVLPYGSPTLADGGADAASVAAAVSAVQEHAPLVVDSANAWAARGLD